MQQLLFIGHLLICIFLVMLVLVQQGKGATMGAGFGGGASQTVFGSQGTGSFLFKMTALFAALFFATSMGIGYFTVQQSKAKVNAQEMQVPVPQSQPSVPVPAKN